MFHVTSTVYKNIAMTLNKDLTVFIKVLKYLLKYELKINT
jgi:hypothetical protein